MPNKGVCFVCGSLGGEFSLQTKALNKGPHFPFLEHHDPPKGSRVPGPDGIVDSCRVCFSFLTQQWEAYERNKTPAVKRLYWLKRSDNGHFTGAEMKLQGEYMAQVMGLQYQTGNDTGYTAISPVESRSNYSRDGYPHSVASMSINEDVRPKSSNTDGVLDLSLPPTKHLTEKVQNCKSRQTNKNVFVCFTCSTENPNSSCKIISSVKHAEGVPYFPFLEKIAPPRGAVPLSEKGVARVCEQCFFTLHHQWVTYEQTGTPPTSRMYSIGDSYSGSTHHNTVKQGHEKSQKDVAEICYLCGQSYSVAMIKPLYTIPSVENKLQMYFPFVRELRRPQGSQPLNPDGTVLVCQNCHSNLQSQWNLYESENISFLQRRYSLLPVDGPLISHSRNPVPVSTEKLKLPKIHVEESQPQPSADADVSITQPLNIHISKSPLPSSQTTAQGLLAIAQPLVKTEEPDTASLHNNVSSAANQSVNSVLAAKVLEHHRHLSESVKSVNNSTIPHPLQHAGALPKSVCFVCGENTLLNQAQSLCSYPTRHDTKLPNSQAAPFFPFLVNRDPAPGAEAMGDDGTVVSCSYCYYSLLSQWKMYEESKDPDDHKRWVRKYAVGEFICYVCSRGVSRKSLRNLEVKKFSFLTDHPVPKQAIAINDGDNVVVCQSCHFSLSHQLAEYERLGLPYELHKYNWNQQSSGGDSLTRDQVT